VHAGGTGGRQGASAGLAVGSIAFSFDSTGFSAGRKAFSVGGQGFSAGRNGFSVESKAFSDDPSEFSDGSMAFSDDRKAFSDDSKGFSDHSMAFSDGPEGFSVVTETGETGRKRGREGIVGYFSLRLLKFDRGVSRAGNPKDEISKSESNPKDERRMTETGGSRRAGGLGSGFP
jgi:hypothetical protein